MFTNYMITSLLAAAPVSEARGAIIYGAASGLNIYHVLILSIILNILIVPAIFYALELTCFKQMVNKLMGQRITDLLEKNKEKFEIYEELALLLFVAIPIPGTGAWTGTILASVLNLDKKKAFAAIALGVVIAAVIVFLGVLGVSFFAKLA